MARPALLIPILILPLLLSLSAPLILTKLRIFGLYNRELRELNNHQGQCERILSLRSCEDTWLHSDSGLLYAACGNSPEDRQTWFPCNDHWDVLARTGRDYLAVLDTRNVSAGSSHTARTKVLKLRNFHGLAGEGSLTVHGMGTWVDPSDPERLRLFIVNHRPPVDALTGAVQLEESQRGANSTIEIFETRLGSDEATHVRTVAHPLIRTPNDVDGIDGDSFYVTNDHHVKRGHRKILDMFFPLTEVVHCDLTGCKVALKGLTFANGIARDARNPLTWYLSATASEKFYVLTRNERDNTLQIDAEVNLPYPTDNIYASPDEGGGAYVTVFPRLPELLDHFHHPRTKGSAAGVMKISKNDQHDAFFGEKYKVERVYEDLDVDPESPSGITGVAVDEQRGKMFLASLYQPHMWECEILEKPHRVKFA